MDTKCLAALAVFRELYDSKKDIYDIIYEFMTSIICTENLQVFTAKIMEIKLKAHYDFDLPQAVIITSLKRSNFAIENGQYSNINVVSLKETITENYEEKTIANNFILEKLIKYVEQKQNFLLNKEEKNILEQDFCSFMLNKTATTKYETLISAFIIEISINENDRLLLNTIKEGVILYTGLQYSDPNNLNKLGTWNTEMTIYLDHEILFHFADYNGSLYKNLFDDFYGFVKEINNKSLNKKNKKLIHLKFFSETKNEIDNFFRIAEYILEGKMPLNPSKIAMTSITAGCKTISDVIAKKALFYKLLHDNTIIEENEEDYYSDKNYKYNIESVENIETLTQDLNCKLIYPNIKYLNYVSIKRREKNNSNFENAKYVLLTDNHLTHNIAFHPAIKKNSSVPLSTSMIFITNRFWFKLQKGFGNNNSLMNFNIVTQAQIVFSSVANNSVLKKYDQVIKKVENNEITEDNANFSLVQLRAEACTPENITEQNIDNMLLSSTSGIESYIHKNELQKKQTAEIADKNKNLEEKLREQREQSLKKDDELASYRKKDLEDTTKQLEKAEKIKRKIDKDAKARLICLRTLWGLVCIIIVIVAICNWDTFVPLTWGISFICINIFGMIKFKTFNPLRMIKNFSEKLKQRQYQKQEVDESELQKLRTKIEELSSNDCE